MKKRPDFREETLSDNAVFGSGRYLSCHERREVFETAIIGQRQRGRSRQSVLSAGTPPPVSADREKARSYGELSGIP